LQKLLLLYIASATLIFAGLLCLRQSLHELSSKEKMIKATLPSPPKNYGKTFLIGFGVLCIVCGLLLLTR